MVHLNRTESGQEEQKQHAAVKLRRGKFLIDILRGRKSNWDICFTKFQIGGKKF